MQECALYTTAEFDCKTSGTVSSFTYINDSFEPEVQTVFLPFTKKLSNINYQYATLKYAVFNIRPTA